MKTTAHCLAAFLITVLLVMTPGCYTQIATTDDKYSDEYAGAEESGEAIDTTAPDGEKYFDDEGYPLTRFYLGVSPSWVYGGVYWSAWSPWAYDPFWCWNPYPAYYGPGWGYWPPYYYPPAYYPPYYPGGAYANGYNTTRRIGSTRGGARTVRASGGGYTRGAEGTRAVDVATPGRTSLDIPDAARLSRPGTGKSATPAAKTKPERLQRGERGKSTGAGVRSGSARNTGRETVRTPRRAPRSTESQPSVTGGGRTPSTSGAGRESVRPSSPAPSGGNAGRGASRPTTPPSGGASGRGGGRR